jgi:hypothetical protein
MRRSIDPFKECKPEVTSALWNVPACDLERSLRDIRGVDLAAGTFLGDGDRDGTRACSDVEHDARVASGVYFL